jgi:hypothetical protein
MLVSGELNPTEDIFPDRLVTALIMFLDSISVVALLGRMLSQGHLHEEPKAVSLVRGRT